MADRTRSSAIASRSAEFSPSTCPWPTNSSSVCGSHPQCKWRDTREPLLRRVREQVAHCREVCSAGPWRPRLTRTSQSRSCPARGRRTTSATCARTSCSRCRSRLTSRCTLTSCCSRRCTSPRSCGSSSVPPRSRGRPCTSVRASLRRLYGCSLARRSACNSSRASSTCSSRCLRGSTRSSAVFSDTAAGSTHRASETFAG